MAYPDDMDAIRAGLKQNMPALAAQLAPGGYVVGDGYWPVNPARSSDTKPGSFVIDIYGDKAGRFIDFASPTDMKGDAIDLIALLEFGCIPPDGRGDAIKWARKWLSLPGSERRPPARFAKRTQFSDPRPDEAKQESAKQWWLKAPKLEPGSVGWTYLTQARSIPLQRLKRPPGAIRTVPRLNYNRDDPDKGKVFPGLLTCMTDGAGVIKAVHRTFLKADGSGKAPVEKPKQMWPATKGLSIRVTRGKTGLSPEECARRGICEDRQVLLEGIEDGLTWGVMFPEDRVTAVGAVSLFHTAPLFDCAREFLIVADNDHMLKSGELDRIALDIQARAGGRPVQYTAPLGAKDVNEAFAALAVRA